MTHLFLLLILPEYLINDNGDGTISRYIAGGAHGDKEELSGTVTDVGNGWCNETDDDERYHKAQELAEDTIEGEECSNGSFIEEIAENYTQDDGNDDSCQKWCFDFCQKWHFDSFHIRSVAF